MGVVNKIKCKNVVYEIEDEDAQNDIANIYTKEEVDELLKALTGFNFEIVAELPSENISTHTIYLLPVDSENLENGYTEYIRVNNEWQILGTTKDNFSDYYTKSEIKSLLDGKQDSLIIENELLENSENLVTNKTITLAINKKANLTDITAALQMKADLSDVPSKLTDLENDGDFIRDADYVHTDNNFSTEEKNKLASIASGAEKNIQSDWAQTDENEEDFIKNKPNLADVALSGSYVDLIDEPTSLSYFTNDPGFIDNTVNDLKNYYLKSDVYSKLEINDLLKDISGIQIKVVESLPAEDIKTNCIYMIPSTDVIENDNYDEYLYVNSKWERIGTTTIDLSKYYTKEQIDSFLNDKENTITKLPVEKGGTNASTTKEATYNLFLDIDESIVDVTDTDSIITSVVTPSASTGAFRKRSVSRLWNWIADKISSVFGLNEDTFSGTADKAKSDINGNQIDTTYVPKTTTINDKELADNIVLTASDVGALPADGTAVNATNATNATKAKQDANGNQIDTTYVPKTTTINDKELADNIVLTASDVGALPADGTAVNATNATNATKAKQDANGNVINSTYLTKTDASNTYQPKGSYQAAGDYVENEDLQKYAIQFNSISQINTITGSTLTSGTATVLGSSTVDIWTALKTYGNAKASNATAYLSGLEVGDSGYTKYLNSSKVYESQCSVEFVYVHKNGKGYAHIISKTKNQEIYTMYMNSTNTALDGVWQKDSEKLLTQDMMPSTAKPFRIGNKEDKVIGSYLTSLFGNQEVTYATVYHPKAGEKQNNLLLGAQRNTVVGSGQLTHDAFYNGNIQGNTANNTLHLCGQDKIEFATGSQSYSTAKKSTLDSNGVLTLNGSRVPTFKYTGIGISTQTRDSDGKQLYPYHLLAYREFNIKGKNCYNEFYFNVYLQYFAKVQECKCKLGWQTTYTSSTTSTTVGTVPRIEILQVNEGADLRFFKALKVRYTHTSNDTMKIWIYMDFSNIPYSYYSVCLTGGMDTIASGYQKTPDGAGWTYYQKAQNTTQNNCYATMEGESDGAQTGYGSMGTGPLSVHNLLTSVNSNFTGTLKVAGNTTLNGSTNSINNPVNIWKVGDGSTDVQLRRSGTSGSYAISFVTTKSDGTQTFNEVINSAGECTLLTKTNANITKTTDTTNGDKLQIGSGTAVNVTNAKNATNATNATSASNATGYCDTAANTQNKAITIANWVSGITGQFLINFKYANSYVGQINASINGATAVPVYIDGVISSSGNYILPAGTYLVNYDGSKMIINPASSAVAFILSGTNLFFN